MTRQQAKVELKKKGWSYRAAAPVLGVTFRHLAYVLSGERPSRRVLRAIGELPANKTAKEQA